MYIHVYIYICQMRCAQKLPPRNVEHDVGICILHQMIECVRILPCVHAASNGSMRAYSTLCALGVWAAEPPPRVTLQMHTGVILHPMKGCVRILPCV